MRKHSYALITITIIVMLIIIASATYAFFATNLRITNNVVLNATISDASRATFTSYSSDPLQLNVGLANAISASTVAVVTDTGNLIVKYSSPNDNSEYECVYDIVYVWDSLDQYISPSMTLTTLYPYEISLAATANVTGDSFSSYNYTSKNLIEKDLSQFSWVGSAGTSGRYSTIISDAKIYTNSVSGTTVTWTFNMNFYSLTSNQTAFSGKSLVGHISTNNIRC